MALDAPPHALEIALNPGMGGIAPEDWDRLTDPSDPFTTHAFLRTLEDSGSACAETGWAPAHVTVRRGGDLVAACPAWVKNHSYGEYIFDWSWAQAAQRAGLPYYPKVVVAVPFTPAQSRRLLVHPSAGQPGFPTVEALHQALFRGLQALAETAEAWSIHVLFCRASEQRALSALGATPRLTHQFHWVNEGYESFEEWLGRFRSKLRKEARRERRRAEQLGVKVRTVRGNDLEPRHWRAMETFYRDTCSRKWGEAYLTPDFFARARVDLAHLAVGLLAEAEGRVVASSLLFQRGQHLYGRYWGCEAEFEQLHFELCYHRPIELCIEHGWTRFEAGAQGTHKLRRGLLPSATHSAHWLRHPGLARAVAQAMQEEAGLMRQEMLQLAAHGPFRRE